MTKSNAEPDVKPVPTLEAAILDIAYIIDKLTAVVAAYAEQNEGNQNG